MPDPTQANRPLAITTELGADELLLRQFHGREQLSRMFSYSVELLSENKNIDATKIIGTKASVRFDSTNPDAKKSRRFFHGYVNQFAHTGFEARKGRYEAVIVPWLWFLTQRADCRIFQEKKVEDILAKVFRDAGFSDFEFRLAGSYDPLEFCVQYNETDFNFISRLCEWFGIFYLFKHEENKHTVIFTDTPDRIRDGERDIDYRWDPNAPRAGYGIHEWRVGKEVKTGAFVHDDFNFKKPKSDLLTKVNSPKEHAMAKFEVYEYPGEYFEKGHGDGLARLRIEELQAQHEVVNGSTNDQELFSGAIFNLKECPMSDQNRGYLTTSTEISISSDDFTSGGGSGELDFSCSFSVIPVTQRFRPSRMTPKPMIGGPQTATVVGPKGEEIYTDEHGRVKVQFHWDREGKMDQNSSKWIRCSSPWAGKSWGGISIPRIGQEVIVEFLEGDPDRPIITGRVYNGEQKPPYDLPDNKTQSGMKTRSSMKGGPDNFNEIRFEDKKGEEEVYVHAEKDFNCVVENSETRKVGYDDKDPGNQKIEIYNNQDLIVGGNQTIDIGKGIKKAGDQTIKIYNSRTATIGKDDTVTIQKGNYTRKVSMGKTLNQAMQSIELKCGASSIKMTPSSITIKSPTIKIKGDAMVDVKAGAMTKVTAGAMLQLQGTLVKIN